MKKYLILIVLLFPIKIFPQYNSKLNFQKARYDLGLYYYEKENYEDDEEDNKKDNLKKALELFSTVAKIKPDNEYGADALKKISLIKSVLRKELAAKIQGSWELAGGSPIWSVQKNKNEKNKESINSIVIDDDRIRYYEQDKKTLVKKLIKTEDFVYFNYDKADALFATIILSDNTIWKCLINEKGNELRLINTGKRTEHGVRKILANNKEQFYFRTK